MESHHRLLFLSHPIPEKIFNMSSLKATNIIMESINMFLCTTNMPGTTEGLGCEQNWQGSWPHEAYVPMKKDRKYINKLGVNINLGKAKSYEENITSATG